MPAGHRWPRVSCASWPGDRFEVVSAGYRVAAEVCPDAIEAMREAGIDSSGQHPRTTDAFIGQRLSYVITLCDRQKDRSCPIFPGVIMGAPDLGA